jgi:hypothetical protein
MTKTAPVALLGDILSLDLLDLVTGHPHEVLEEQLKCGESERASENLSE